MVSSNKETFKIEGLDIWLFYWPVCGNTYVELEIN